MDFRLKGISVESKNAKNGLRMRKLWSSEVGTAELIPYWARPEEPSQGGQLASHNSSLLSPTRSAQVCTKRPAHA